MTVMRKLSILREIYPSVKLEDLCIVLDFVFAMQTTSLGDPGSGLDVDALYRLCNSFTQPAPFESDRVTIICLGADLFCRALASL